jgi:hypothetical protein
MKDIVSRHSSFLEETRMGLAGTDSTLCIVGISCFVLRIWHSASVINAEVVHNAHSL